MPITKSETATRRRLFGIRASSLNRQFNVRDFDCRCTTPRFDERFLSVRGYGLRAYEPRQGRNAATVV
jgi:hypothetical protein